mmetsp:Transcript_3205/g.5250  ORF Transcript_3205/g.5250 Transcript_3205/m.5250 type:complete len:144 (+) Transcript_3205:258-689(+)|eukprot:CAMPEP_0119015494 /NCGR_PEP_ID=MMETSP1176-20130426/11141_1 /TAXON_ID=265551 /ORGANISM="Synedropsis recta cf, Strain CCMP1620" /LENGTH=143 /DNA_ID=CAMNT_0006968791 /DNA_START=227 /DNA_END=658 /DNA_ORIENTATION=-
MSGITELSQQMVTCQESVEHELAPHAAAFRKLVTKVFPGKQWKTAKDFYKSTGKKYTDDDMFWIYINAVGYQHFRPYAEQEGITNLVNFVNDSIKLKPLKGDSERYAGEFTKIYHRFLAVGAEESIKISSELQQTLKAEVDKL